MTNAVVVGVGNIYASESLFCLVSIHQGLLIGSQRFAIGCWQKKSKTYWREPLNRGTILRDFVNGQVSLAIFNKRYWYMTELVSVVTNVMHRFRVG